MLEQKMKTSLKKKKDFSLVSWHYVKPTRLKVKDRHLCLHKLLYDKNIIKESKLKLKIKGEISKLEKIFEQ